MSEMKSWRVPESRPDCARHACRPVRGAPNNIVCIATAMDKLWRGGPVTWGTMSGVGELEKDRVRETGNATFPVSGRTWPKIKISAEHSL